MQELTYAVVTDVTPNRCTFRSDHSTEEEAQRFADELDTGINGEPAQVMVLQPGARPLPDPGDRGYHAEGVCWASRANVAEPDEDRGERL